MSNHHPTVRDFEGFLWNPSRPASSACTPRILRHLLAECPDCRASLGTLGWSQQRLSLLTSRDGDAFRENAQISRPPRTMTTIKPSRRWTAPSPPF